MTGEGRHLPVLIYALCDPRDMSVRYVGKTERPKERRIAHAHHPDNARVKAWVQLLGSFGQAPIMRGIVRCQRHEAHSEERYWIRFYRRIGEVYNVADGGRNSIDACTECGTRMICERCKRVREGDRKRREEAEARQEKRDARLADVIPIGGAR